MSKPLEKIWTVQKFAQQFGMNPEYIRQCCRGHLDFRMGTELHLPSGWTAQKVGRDWLLFPTNQRAIDRLREKRGGTIRGSR